MRVGVGEKRVALAGGRVEVREEFTRLVGHEQVDEMPGALLTATSKRWLGQPSEPGLADGVWASKNTAAQSSSRAPLPESGDVIIDRHSGRRRRLPALVVRRVSRARLARALQSAEAKVLLAVGMDVSGRSRRA